MRTAPPKSTVPLWKPGVLCVSSWQTLATSRLHAHGKPAWLGTHAAHALTTGPRLLRRYNRTGACVLCAQKQQQQKPVRKSKPDQPLSRQRSRQADVPSVQTEEAKWALLDWSAYNQPWQVPWGWRQVAGGMAAWAISFVLVGLAILPLVAAFAGVKDLSSLSQTDKSFYAFWNQVLETVVGLGIINLVVSKSKPFPDDVFKFSLREPFRKGSGWAAWALAGTIASPFVIGLTATALSAAGYDGVGGRGTVDGVAQMINLDLPSYASLFSVTAILAPLLEETVFRGFLLTSLTKWMPTWAAVFVSAGCFGVAHLSLRDLPQLIALGTLLGFVYVRSRNLLTPMIIHGAWNGTVLTILYMLAASGVNLQEVLASPADAFVQVAGFLSG
ncbi:hypothetical protein WJX72_011921 [[Myrmecia] bisecta]|uniref:CAAX prenyl protease 2/Lysostaphin resistance protein A-like domain-containing protein n=1 Tax=[Myrmecia] bisecta TaxID=41462 RepID=A0AAW1RA87_9CHLO